MSSSTHTTDVVVIGAGPVGLFAIFECGMLGLKCHVIDALESVGGQCTALYPEKPIYDIPAHPNILAGDLINSLEHQAAPFSPTYHLGQQVEKVHQRGDGKFDVTTSNGVMIETSTIIIAAGVGAFGPNRPPLADIEAYEKSGSIHYYVKNREQFRGKRLVIAGGGDSAIDWTISLSELAEHITLVHRRPKFRAAPETVSQVHALAEQGKVDLAIPYQLESLEGDNGSLTAVNLATLSGEKRQVHADILLPFYGLATNLGPIATWGLNLERNHILVDQKTCQSSTKGIFAIGDIAHYESKLKLILTGFSEAAHAAHAIRAHLFPDEVFHFEYSTTQGVPK